MPIARGDVAARQVSTIWVGLNGEQPADVWDQISQRKMDWRTARQLDEGHAGSLAVPGRAVLWIDMSVIDLGYAAGVVGLNPAGMKPETLVSVIGAMPCSWQAIVITGLAPARVTRGAWRNWRPLKPSTRRCAMGDSAHIQFDMIPSFLGVPVGDLEDSAQTDRSRLSGYFCDNLDQPAAGQRYLARQLRYASRPGRAPAGAIDLGDVNVFPLEPDKAFFRSYRAMRCGPGNRCKDSAGWRRLQRTQSAWRRWHN